MSDYVLLTGATGLLGRYLLKDLLMSGHQVCAVVRADSDEHARERVSEIVEEWESTTGTAIPQPACFAGDVCDSMLGMSGEALQWVPQNCNFVLHNAAIVAFDENANGEPARTNLGGTENVLEFCGETGIRHFHYVSTAYVCGLRDEKILESELDCGQAFRNAYEHSKFEAERRVHACDFFDSVTIYRPAVIAGDSRNGYTYTYHGIYHYLKLISVLVRNIQPDENGVRHTPVRLEMTGDETRNVVTVDWVSSVICRLFENPEAHGRTFHLAPDVPITPRQIIEAGYSFFNSKGVEFVGPKTELNGASSQMEKDWRSNRSVYQNYELSDPEFDMTNLKRFAGEIDCPVIDEKMLHRFWQYGEQDGWGKRSSSRKNSTEAVECANQTSSTAK